MANTNLAARVSPREFAIVAYHAGMTDATVSEIGKYSIRRLAGDSHEEARRKALTLRGNHTVSAEEKVVGIRIPEEWLEDARQNAGDGGGNSSFLLRYSLARLAADDNEARKLAHRNMGPKSDSR